MNKSTLLCVLGISLFLNSQGFGQDFLRTCAISDDSTSEIISNALIQDAKAAPHSDALWNVLARHNPRFWNEMSTKGRAETVDTLWNSLNLQNETGDDFDESQVEAALRFARINESIRNQEDLCNVVKILNPRLEKDLGFGVGVGFEMLENFVKQLLKMGNAENGTFSTLNQFRSAYQLTVEENWSGK